MNQIHNTVKLGERDGEEWLLLNLKRQFMFVLSPPVWHTCFFNFLRCPEGFQGVGCKTPFCRAGCYNGGTCVKPNVCKCTEGFEGPACLSPLCQPPCRYGGKCIGPGTCRCSHGFIGSRCEKKRCLVTCLNGGKCIGPYVCQCMPGYSGQRCEIGRSAFSLQDYVQIKLYFYSGFSP